MATQISSGTIQINLALAAIQALNALNANANLNLPKSYAFANGAGAGQASQYFADVRTLAASASETLQITTAGALKDPLGNVVNLSRVAAIMIIAAPGNTNDVVVGDAAADAWVGMLNAAGTINIKPGGMFLAVAPTAAGFPVTATTADQVKIANGGSGTGISYTIVLLG